RSGLPTAVTGKLYVRPLRSGLISPRSSWSVIAVSMWLLISDGARKALLNDTRNVCGSDGLIRNVVRGEKTGLSLMDENLSTRPPTTQRKWLLKKISS